MGLVFRVQGLQLKDFYTALGYLFVLSCLGRDSFRTDPRELNLFFFEWSGAEGRDSRFWDWVVALGFQFYLLPIVSIVVPCFGLTKYIIRIL